MSREVLWRWAPAVLLVLGAVATVGIDRQRQMPLRAELNEVIPGEIHGYAARDIELSENEVRVAGVTTYLMREFMPGTAVTDSAAPAGFSLYVGYYDSQTQGKTIHSPKNCLPGAGWDALQSQEVQLATPVGTVPANRYLLQREDQRALVVYWYQGRGRVEANEYLVKAQLLRDAALRGRTEEALVRIVVPIMTNEEDAFRLASSIAAQVIPTVNRALPV